MSPAEQPVEISKNMRVRLWLIAWVVALAITPIPFCITSSPSYLIYFAGYAWAFPVGTIGFWFPNPPDYIMTTFVLGGWLFYIALTFVGLSQNKRFRYYMVYAFLCALLILNVVGCNVGLFQGINQSLKGGFHM